MNLSRQSVAVQVTAAFYRVIQQRHLRAVARQSLERNRTLREASLRRLEVGLVSKLDVFRAELQAAQAEEAQVRADSALETALEQFRVLLGLAPEDPLEPADVQLPETLPEAEPIQVLLERARRLRLDLLEAGDRVDDARRALALARQNVLPQLDVQLQFAQLGNGSGYTGDQVSLDRRVTVNVTSSYPLERTRALTDRTLSELALGARERDARQRALGVDAEVRAAARELKRIRQSVTLQRRSVDVAEQQLRLATLRYQRGLASNFDVVDAEGSVVLARSTLVTLLASHEVGLVELRRATGELGADPAQVDAPATEGEVP